MSAAVQLSSLESPTGSLILTTIQDLTRLGHGNQEILKISSQQIGNRMQGMCRFEKGFEKLLPLFRGLVLLGKPTSLSLIYDFEKAQVFFTYSKVEQEDVDRFFDQVISLLKKEIRFKQLLQKVIENNKRHQAEQALLQATLQGSSWD